MFDQDAARQLGPLAEAVANAFMVVFYQAETGRATPTDFREALDAVRQSLPGLHRRKWRCVPALEHRQIGR